LDGGFGGVLDGDGLHATTGVAALIGGRPGAENHFSEAALIADGIAVAKRDLAAEILGRGDASAVGARIIATFQHAVGWALNGGLGRILHGDGLHATVAVATFVDRSPHAGNDFGSRALVAHTVCVKHGYPAASILGRRDSRRIGAGVSPAFKRSVGRTLNHGLERVPDGNGLHAGTGVATPIEGGPGAQNDLRARALVAHGVSVEQVRDSAAILSRGHAGDVGASIGRAF